MRCQLDNLQWMEEGLGAGRTHSRMRDEGRGASQSDTIYREYRHNHGEADCSRHAVHATWKASVSLIEARQTCRSYF